MTIVPGIDTTIGTKVILFSRPTETEAKSGFEKRRRQRRRLEGDSWWSVAILDVESSVERDGRTGWLAALTAYLNRKK